MSGRYLYAVVPLDTPPPAGLRGLAGAPVAVHEAPSFAVWWSEASKPPAATMERVRRHNSVVEAAFAAGRTPLPLRFGQWLPGREELEAFVGERTEPLARGLARVAGAAEFGIRAARPVAAPPVEASAGGGAGTAYLERLALREAARREARELGEGLLDELRARLAGLVREERVEPAAGAGALSLSHLVARADETAYRERVRDVRDRVPDLRLLVTGPWPPYSFSE